MKLLGTVLLLFSFFAMADRVNIIAPIEREECIQQDANGNCLAYDPLTPEEISHFNIFDMGMGPEVIVVVPGTERTFTVERTKVVRDLVMTTVDTEDRESLFSPVIQIPKKLLSRPKSGSLSVVAQ